MALKRLPDRPAFQPPPRHGHGRAGAPRRMAGFRRHPLPSLRCLIPPSLAFHRRAPPRRRALSVTRLKPRLPRFPAEGGLETSCFRSPSPSSSASHPTLFSLPSLLRARAVRNPVLARNFGDFRGQRRAPEFRLPALPQSSGGPGAFKTAGRPLPHHLQERRPCGHARRSDAEGRRALPGQAPSRAARGGGTRDRDAAHDISMHKYINQHFLTRNNLWKDR